MGNELQTLQDMINTGFIDAFVPRFKHFAGWRARARAARAETVRMFLDSAVARLTPEERSRMEERGEQIRVAMAEGRL